MDKFYFVMSSYFIFVAFIVLFIIFLFIDNKKVKKYLKDEL